MRGTGSRMPLRTRDSGRRTRADGGEGDSEARRRKPSGCCGLLRARPSEALHVAARGFDGPLSELLRRAGEVCCAAGVAFLRTRRGCSSRPVRSVCLDEAPSTKRSAACAASSENRTTRFLRRRLREGPCDGHASRKRGFSTTHLREAKKELREGLTLRRGLQLANLLINVRMPVRVDVTKDLKFQTRPLSVGSTGLSTIAPGFVSNLVNLLTRSQ